MSKYHPSIHKILNNADRFVRIPSSSDEDYDLALGNIVLSFWDDFNHCLMFTKNGCSVKPVELTTEEEEVLCEKFFEAHFLVSTSHHQCSHLDDVILGF